MSKKYESLANEIIEKVGGVENVDQLTHCMTRLRFTLKDNDKASVDNVKAIDGVINVILGGGQFQVVIGPDVQAVYETICKLHNLTPKESTTEEAPTDQKTSAVAKVLDVIAGCFGPIVGALAGAGMVKALLSLFSVFGWIDPGGQTYALLTIIGDSFFYFLPFILAVSAATKFKTSPYLAMALAGVLLHPNFVALKEAGDPVYFLGMFPVGLVSYSSSVIPILLIVWLQSYVERFFKKISPEMIKIFFVPLMVMLICAPAGLIAIGPLGNMVGEVVANFLSWLEGYGSWIVPTIIGAFAPLLVMTGTHYSLVSVRYMQIGMVGYECFLMPAMLVSNVCQGAASLAVSLKSKNKDLKTLSLSSGLTAICGVTEPALYGITIKIKTALYATMIGGACGGFYAGLMGVRNYSAGGHSLLGLPTFIGENTMYSFYHEAIAVAIGFVVTFLIVLLIGIKEDDK